MSCIFLSILELCLNGLQHIHVLSRSSVRNMHAAVRRNEYTLVCAGTYVINLMYCNSCTVMYYFIPHIPESIANFIILRTLV